jgi:antitoxin YefM
MAISTTYTEARANLAGFIDQVADDREVVIIRRRGHEDVALVAASELSSLLETAHLLRSPKNAARLHSALRRALAGEGEPQTVTDLKREFGFGEE